MAYIKRDPNFIPANSNDKDIKKMCDKIKIPVIISQDYYLYEPGSITTNGQIYTKFTPYYLKAIKYNIKKPVIMRSYHFIKINDGNINLRDAYFKFTVPNNNILVNGGREEAVNIIGSLGLSSFKKYNINRRKYWSWKIYIYKYFKRSIYRVYSCRRAG